MRTRCLALALALAACTGCGKSRPFLAPLHVTETSDVQFVRTAPPSTNGPGFGAEHLAFLSQRLGFVATTGGGGYVQKVGYVPPSEPAEIDRTEDGGVTWLTVWRGAHTQLNWIAFADRRHGAAGGVVVRRHSVGINARGLPFVLVTTDGGDTWIRRSSPRWLPNVRPQLIAADFWVASGRRLYLSRDAGAHWVQRPLPAGIAFTEFASARVGYAAARGIDCAQQIWKTTDGSVRWFPLAGTCARSYSSLDFLGERTGYAATGLRAYDLGAVSDNLPLLVIKRTDDGGATWRTVYRISNSLHAWPADTRLHFSDPAHGWAESSELNQGFEFDTLHRTSDGGRTWTTVRYPALSFAFTHGDRAWAGADQAIWRTADFGRSWRVSIRAQNVQPSQLLIATRSQLVIDSAVGAVRSTDGGRSWRSTPPPSARAIAVARGEAAYIRAARGEFGTAMPVRLDGTVIHRPRRVRSDLGAVSFVDARKGLIASGQQGSGEQDGTIPVFATSDGGRSWQTVRLPTRLEENSPASIAHGAIAVLQPPELYLSADNGAHWRSARVRTDFWDCGVQRPTPKAIWVLCSLSVTRHVPQSILFRSDDGGRSWRRLRASAWLDTRFVAVDRHEAWAETKPSGDLLATGSALWHTTDGGAHWYEVWPRVAPDAVVRDYRFFGPHLLTPTR